MTAGTINTLSVPMKDAASQRRHAHLLPAQLVRPLAGSYTGMYGSEFLAAQYCGFNRPPHAPSGLWQHGWIDESRGNLPANAVFGATISADSPGPFFVATRSLAEILQAQGFSDAHAIGLPITYVPERVIERRPNALLVMPVHIVPQMSPEWNVADYVTAIQSIRDQFQNVVVCISPHCVAAGLWAPEFRAAGFEVIQGASGSDPQALVKMASLFSAFEFVTTNGHGSLLAYAAAFGAKVSIYGPYIEWTRASMASVPFYVDNPDLLQEAELSGSKEFMQRNHPEFFCEPRAARDRSEWGRSQIGFDNRVSPARMRELFGWTSRDRARVFFQNLRARVPVSIRQRVKGMMSRPYRERLRAAAAERLEQRRLAEMPRYVPGKTELFGRTFRFVDAMTYQQIYREIFERQVYLFQCSSEVPLIIDGGANVGLSVLYFKKVYPRSRVIAFEPDPEIFRVLEANVQTYELDGVQLVSKALWESETCLAFKQEGSAAGRLDPDSGTVTVPTCRLRDFMGSRVDFLKLDIEGAELRVLNDSVDLLHNVQSIFVEHHAFRGQPQNLHGVIRIYEDAGFRAYVESASPVARPLIDRRFIGGMDVQTNIFGYRDNTFVQNGRSIGCK